MPAVSIIITNYNGRKYLKECIDSLKESCFTDFELIIVDNGSTDGSVHLIRENYPEVRLLELGGNLGLSIASNRGAQLSRGRYFFFYNNDSIADKKMLTELVKTMKSDPKIGICGCKTLNYSGSKEINCGVEMDIFGYPYGSGRPFYVDAAIFIKREVFEEIGGFDEKMFLYCEDRDLCWRAWLYGYKVVPVQTAIFRHDSVCLIDRNSFSTNTNRRFMNEAFTLRMLFKNYGTLFLFMILPLYFLLCLAEITVYFFKGKIKFVLMSYLQAYYWNARNLADTLRKRETVQRKRRISDREILLNLCKMSGKFLLFQRIGIPEVDSVNRYLNTNN